MVRELAPAAFQPREDEWLCMTEWRDVNCLSNLSPGLGYIATTLEYQDSPWPCGKAGALHRYVSKCMYPDRYNYSLFHNTQM